MIMYFFTVAACISVTLSEDSTFLQSKFPKNHCRRKKYVALSSSFQTNLRDKTKLYIQLTVNGFEKHIESSQRENFFYFTVKSDSLPLIYAKELEFTVQQFVVHHRTDLQDPNKMIILVHAFYIEKMAPTGEL